MIGNSLFQQMSQDIGSGGPVILMVTADGECAPCEQAKPIFESAQVVMGDDAKFYSFKASELDPSFLRARGVRSAPTVMMFSFGLESHRLSGNEVQMLGPEVTRFIENHFSENTGVSDDFECEACQ